MNMFLDKYYSLALYDEYMQKYISPTHHTSQLTYTQGLSYSTSNCIYFVPLENYLTPYHPEKLKRGISSDVAHPQSKYSSTYENSWI